jgi:hypothetical protein
LISGATKGYLNDILDEVASAIQLEIAIKYHTWHTKMHAECVIFSLKQQFLAKSTTCELLRGDVFYDLDWVQRIFMISIIQLEYVVLSLFFVSFPFKMNLMLVPCSL